jgi:predicted nucleic acid-binding protein
MHITLLDTNIIIRFYNPASPEHAEAERAVVKLLLAGDLLCVAVQSLVEFWVVATRPVNVNGLAWDTAKTKQTIDQLLTRFLLLEDPPDTFTHWLNLVTAHDIKGKKAHDTRLAAVMQAHGISRLLTFNTGDFKSFTNITALEPHDIK